MMGLTPNQQRLLAFLRSEIAGRGLVPTFDEMCRHMGIVSKGGIFRMLNGLQERGHIRRLPGKSRAIELVEPDDVTAELLALLAAVVAEHDGGGVSLATIGQIRAAVARAECRQ